MQSGRWSGRNTTQSGRLPDESVCWNCVGALRHAVLHDRFHPRLAERAARLLVGEHVAQGRHLRGQVGEVLVRVVDDAEPFMQHAQAVHGVARGRFHRLADPVRHRIQPLVDRARHLGLAAHQRLRHRVDPAGGSRSAPAASLR